MVTLRCTQKLLKRLRVEPEAETPPPTNALGNWYANLIYFGRLQVVMATSELSLLTIVLPADKLRKSLVPNLCEATVALLRNVGVDSMRAIQEAEHMQEVRYARTADRSVLGSMNDLSRCLEGYLYGGVGLMEAMVRLAKMPMTGIASAGHTHDYPARVALRLLGVEEEWERLGPNYGI